MTKSKLIIYLKTLSSAEMKDFGLYLSISKRAKDAQLLFQYLKKYHPSYTAKALDKTKVVHKLFSKDVNKEKKLINAMQRCSRLLDEFFIQVELKTSEVTKDFLFLDALKKRQLDKSFFKKAEQMEKDWEKRQPEGLEHLHNEYKLKEICYSHPDYSLVKKMPISPQSLIEYIDKHYIATKLYWTSGIYHNNFYFPNSNSLSSKQYLIDDLQSVYTEEVFYNVPQIRVFGQLFEAFRLNNFNKYLDIKNDFLCNFDIFTKEEKNDILTALYSACFENYKADKPGALEELFDLNRFILENDFLIENGCFPTERFWVILNVGLAAKEFKWIRNFIQNNYVFLNEDEQQDVLAISNSKLYLYQGEFEKAIGNLTTVKFKNITTGLQSRNILLQCYFELGEDYANLFLDLTKSFYMFLNRKEIFGDTTKLAFNNFITFCKRLHKAKIEPDTYNFKLLNNKLNKFTNIANKRWLLDKLEEIEVSTNRNKQIIDPMKSI